MATFRDAVAYPFERFGRLFYWLWVFLPIIGWLAFVGYELRLMRSLLKKPQKEVPSFGPFWENFRNGFFLLVFVLLYTTALVILRFIPVIGILLYLIGLLMLPIAIIQCATGTRFSMMLKRGFHIDRTANLIVSNISSYLLLILKVIGIVALAVVASLPIITILITYPAYRYAQWYLITDFWRTAKRK